MKTLIVGGLGIGGVSTHLKSIIKEFESMGIKVELYDFYTKRGWRPDKRDIITLYENIKKLFKISFGLFFHLIFNKYRMVHIHSSGQLSGYIPVLFILVFKKIFKYKVIITYHSANLKKFRDNHERLLKYGYKNAEYHIPVSMKQYEVIRSVSDSQFAEKVFPIPNGYDPAKYSIISKKEARRKNGISEDTKLIVTVGWLMEKKGQIYLIDAMKIIKDKQNFKNIKCKIIGQGPLNDQLENEIKARGLSNEVELTGYLEFDTMNQIMCASDIFVLPSLEEGNPIVMFEALGLGLPVVGTTVGGIPEIIKSEDHGLIVEPKNSKSLSITIEKALMKKWNNKKILEYSKNFTWYEIAKKTYSVYQKCM